MSVENKLLKLLFPALSNSHTTQVIALLKELLSLCTLKHVSTLLHNRVFSKTSQQGKCISFLYMHDCV